MDSPFILAVAPNGARRVHTDHPRVPITGAELARDARACLDAGAAMLHLHVRDATRAHSLNADHYREAIAAVRKAVGGDLLIQITTESAGRYRPAEQMAVVKALRPEAVSLAIRELAPPGDERAEAEFGAFVGWLREAGVGPQFIVYGAQDEERFEQLGERGVIPGAGHAILRVFGKSAQATQAPADPPLAGSPRRGAWMLCGFDTLEFACVRLAVAAGGHVRVGFENNLKLSDGRRAPDNATLIAEAGAFAQAKGRTLANADQARDLLQPDW